MFRGPLQLLGMALFKADFRPGSAFPENPDNPASSSKLPPSLIAILQGPA